MIGHIDIQVTDRCWNMIDSYGMICVHCGCCSHDKQKRYASRIEVLERWIEEQEKFDRWDDDPEWRVVQERNIRSNLKHFRRMLRYYKRMADKGGLYETQNHSRNRSDGQ